MLITTTAEYAGAAVGFTPRRSGTVAMQRPEFEKLALEHLDALYRMAFHLTRNPERAQDLVQDVYVRALRPKSVEGFESKGGGMRAWLFAIAHNVFYSQIKREKRAPQAVGEFFAETSDEPLPDEPPPVWNQASLDWDHVDQRLKNALDDLKPEYREVLMMWGVDGLKYREIATILDVPIGTVMSRLYRARKLVTEKLGAEGVTSDLGITVDPEQPQ
jgi:RNA polymerase sigma-70 factor (ECF subfamily)